MSFDYAIAQDTLMVVGQSLLDTYGVNWHHIKSANAFYRDGIRQIIMVFELGTTVSKPRISNDTIRAIQVEIVPTDIELCKPRRRVHIETEEENPLFPAEALINEHYYSGPLYMSATITATAHMHDGTKQVRTDKLERFKLCRIPIIKGSIKCNTYGMSAEELRAHGEDPSDVGGYFIVRNEMVAECTENITFNQPKYYKNLGYGKSRIRCEIISKPGDTYANSDQLLVKYLTDDTLYVLVMRNQLSMVPIPFFLLFRAMGWSTDRELLDWIIMDYPSNAKVEELIVRAMRAEYRKKDPYNSACSQEEALRHIIDLIPADKIKFYNLAEHPERICTVIELVRWIFDVHCLPHIGKSANARSEKLKFIAMLIRNVLLVEIGQIKETDRDSFRNKRLFAAGENIAKSVKTFVNQTIAIPIKKNITSTFNREPFGQVNLQNLIKSVIGDEFEKAIIQAIISGKKSMIRVKHAIKNHLSTQIVSRKNQLGMFAALRLISVPSADNARQSKRAIVMRSIHPTQVGYVDVVHSPPESEKVGISKQLALFAFIAPPSSSEMLRKIVADDVINPHKLSPQEIYKRQLARIFVNGYLVGYTEDSLTFVFKYRQMRRHQQIDPYTTVFWDSMLDDVHLLVDVGRLSRPLMIVYNNRREFDLEMVGSDEKSAAAADFQQGLMITQADLDAINAGTKTIDDLVGERKVEYITPEEQENCLVCSCFDKLRKHRGDELLQYTHCDIPQAILGITSITAPYGHHNQAPRVIYQTAQAKQTCGVYALNWPYRMDKEAFLQYVCETPLVRTVGNKMLRPNGCNIMIVIGSYTGFNQEDSLIVNKAAIERGLFGGCKFTYIGTEFDQKETMGIPDVANTDGLKAANYSKLGPSGVVPPGTIVEADDVIIGKFMLAPNERGNKKYIDRSIVYKKDEPAIVQKIIVGNTEDGTKMCKVALRLVRPTRVGDKFCVPADTEVMTMAGWKTIDTVDTTSVVATLNNGVFEWCHPCGTVEFDHIGDMYSVETDTVSICATMEHKMYVRRDANELSPSLVAASALLGAPWVQFTRELRNRQPNSVMFVTETNIVMQQWFTLIGYFLRAGSVNDALTRVNLPIVASALHGDNNVIDRIIDLANLQFWSYQRTDNCLYIENQGTAAFLSSLAGKLPQCCLTAGTHCCTGLLFGVMGGDLFGILGETFIVESLALADSVQILAIMSELSATVVSVGDRWQVIVRPNSEFDTDIVVADVAQVVQFNGKVYCIEVPSGVFMMRRNGKYMWTGNSSRSGQKGICAHLMQEADMMFTVNGERPAAIFNPHGIPSRMTMAQLIESMIGIVCADKGAHTDGTMFVKVDINSISAELVARGFQKHGYVRMLCGITGEFIDCLMFYGPVFYQRLMKFIDDQQYAVRNALTDAVTQQPLSGQGAFGGLRIGEMEQNCFVAHGSMNSMSEKFRAHSDGFGEYVCRCGKAAIVNITLRKFKCLYCGDNGDISRRPTTWTAKMIVQELETMNIGLRRIPRAFVKTIMDTTDGMLSQIADTYDDELRRMRTHIRHTFGDGSVMLDATVWKIGDELDDGLE